MFYCYSDFIICFPLKNLYVKATNSHFDTSVTLEFRCALLLDLNLSPLHEATELSSKKY